MVYMYDIHSFGRMVTDKVRAAAFIEALRRTIVPGESTVLEIGTGIGYFAIKACELGARKVYAVEPNDAIDLAREIARDNGYADQIEFINDLSTDIDLPEKVDVIFSDIRGSLPIYENHIPTIVDARERFLAPGGTMIALRDRLFIVPMNTPKHWAIYSKPWMSVSNIDMTAGRNYVFNTWGHYDSTPEEFVAEPRELMTLEYQTITSPNVSGNAEWLCENNSVIHGFSVWFDMELTDGFILSNSPEEPAMVYGRALFPISTPIAVEPGNKILFDLKADVVNDEYIWRWSAKVLDNNDETKGDVSQNTYNSRPLSLEKLKKRRSDYVPDVNQKGIVDYYILGQMQKDRQLMAIARDAYENFPEFFKNDESALAYVGELSLKYS